MGRFHGESPDENGLQNCGMPAFFRRTAYSPRITEGVSTYLAFPGYEDGFEKRSEKPGGHRRQKGSAAGQDEGIENAGERVEAGGVADGAESLLAGGCFGGRGHRRECKKADNGFAELPIQGAVQKCGTDRVCPRQSMAEPRG